nr:MAG TPA: hypothetical protein [Caudoviricetes sp.]
MLLLQLYLCSLYSYISIFVEASLFHHSIKLPSI